jgi:hypothetical protein
MADTQATSRKFNLHYALAIPDAPPTDGSDVHPAPVSSRIEIPTVVEFTTSRGREVGNYSPDPGGDYAVIPWVSDVRWDEPAATAVTMTASSWVTERHPGGFRVADVSITGQIDKLPYQDRQQIAAMQSSLMNAEAGVLPTEEQLRVLPDAFQALMTAMRLIDRAVKDPRLVLHLYSMDEGLFYEVEPLRRARVRSLSNRFGWRFEFQFKALAIVAPPKVDAVMDSIPNIREKEWYEVMEDGLNEAIADVQAVESQINDAIGKVDAVSRRVGAKAREVVGLLQGAVDLMAKVKNQPKRIYQQVMRTVDSCTAAIWDLHVTLGLAGRMAGGPGSGDSCQPIPGPADTASVQSAMVAMHDAESAMYKAANAARDGVLQSQTSTRVYSIQKYDTIQSIAAKTMGDAALFNLLIDLNGLQPPYVAACRGPGVLGPGDTLLLPSRASTQTGTFADPEVSGEERLYGRGVALTDSGDWKLSSDEKGVDEVVGLDCVSQGQRIRFTTVRGSNPIFPSMGMPDVLGEEAGLFHRRSYLVAGIWQANRDDRVAGVRDAKIVEDGDNLGFDCEAVLVDGKSTRARTVGG